MPNPINVQEEYNRLDRPGLAKFWNGVKKKINEKAPAIIVDAGTKHSFSDVELNPYIGYDIEIPTKTGVSTEKIAFAPNIIPVLEDATSTYYEAGDNKIVFNGSPTGASTWYSKINNNTTYTPNGVINEGDTINVCFYVTGTVEALSTGTTPATLYINFLDSEDTVYQHRYDFDMTTGFHSFTFTAEADVVSMRLSCLCRKNYTYTDYTIMFAAVKTASFNSYDLTEAITLTKSDVGLNGITMLPVSGKLMAIADTKEYIDNNIPEDVVTYNYLEEYTPTLENTKYITPEQFGAVGDGVTDDSVAFQAALDAVEQGVPLMAFGNYRINTGLEVEGDYLDIRINRIDYRGTTAPAITMRGSYNRFEARQLYAYFATGQSAFRLTTSADYAMTYNEIIIDDVRADGNGLEFVNELGVSANKHAYYNRINTHSIISTNGHCIYVLVDKHWGENSFWCKHIRNPKGYVYYVDPTYTYGANPSIRLYEFCIEGSSKNGIFGAATLINCRTTECQDRRTSSDEEGWLFVFDGIKPTGRAVNTNVLYTGVDVSNAITYSDLLDKAQELYEAGYATAGIVDNAFTLDIKEFNIGHAAHVSPFISGWENSDYTQGGTIFAYLNHKGFIPDYDWYKEISSATYYTWTTAKEFPTIFDIKANTTIYLDDSYCAIGINKIKVIQNSGFTATIYDSNNNVVFNGANYGVGEFIVTSELRDPDDVILTKTGGTLTIPGRVLRGHFFGSNQEWTVERVINKDFENVINNLIIYDETDSKHTFTETEMRALDSFSVEIPVKTGISTEYIALKSDLIPDLDSYSATNIVKPVGNTMKINGEMSSALNYYGRVSTESKFAYNGEISNGELATLFLCFDGNVEPASGVSKPIVATLKLWYSNDTNTQNYVEISPNDKFGAVTVQATDDVTKIGIQISINKGIYTNYEICWAAIKGASSLIQANTLSNALSISNSITGKNGITMLPVNGRLKHVANTKEYIDDHVPDDMLKEGDLYYITPEMFGAVGDGNADDSVAMQDAMDYCAIHNKPLNVSKGIYKFGNVKLYNGYKYEIFGSFYTSTPEWNGKPASGLYIKNNTVGFIGERSSQEYTIASLPIVRMTMRDVTVKGENGTNYPVFIKDVRLLNSRFLHVGAHYLSCFIEGMINGSSIVSDCEIEEITECAFRAWTNLHGLINANPSFTDARFIANQFSGLTRGMNQLFYPSVFEGNDFYHNFFENNFVANFWSVVKTYNGKVWSWLSSNNIYTFVPQFMYYSGNSEVEYSFVASNMINDSIWYADYDTLTDTAEGKQYFDDYNNNTRIPGSSVHFLNFDEIDNSNIRELTIRRCERLLKDETKFRCSTITRAYSYTVYPYEPEDVQEAEAIEEIFDTCIPIEDYTTNIDEYKHTKIISWNDRRVTNLPTIEDNNYRYVLEGQTCYYNQMLFVCHGNSWYNVAENPDNDILFASNIPGTTQTVVFNNDGDPVSITHSKNNTAVRTDTFVWSPSTVVETRVLPNGKYITITTNLVTLETTVSDVLEAV